MKNSFLLWGALLVGANAATLAPIVHAQNTNTQNAQAPESPLSGTQWELVSPQYPGLEKAPYLKFTGSRLGASVGCNSMGGSFTQFGGNLAVSSLISTMKACSEPLMDAESKYGAALAGAKTIELSADGREMTLSGAGTLQFRLVSGTPPMLADLDITKPLTPPAPPVGEPPFGEPPVVVGTDANSPSGLNRNGQFRVARTPGEVTGTLFVVRYGAEREVAQNVWNAWPSQNPDLILYSGTDGAGGYENEGQSLWQYDWKRGNAQKLAALQTMIANVFETSANGQKLFVVTSNDGGAGFKYVSVIHPTRGLLWEARNVSLSAIRNETLALQILEMRRNVMSEKMRYVPLKNILAR